MEPIRIRRSVPSSGRLQIKVPKEFAAILGGYF